MLIEQSVITRALFCQDIVELIFDNLSLHSVIYDPSRGDNNRGLLHVEDQCEKRRTLALAARVSKHISEVALSVLWAQLKGFRPLFRLLPQYSLHTWNIEGKPTDADWTRLEKYTRLVREICMFPMDSERKCWEIFRARYRTVGHFLPRLMALATVRITPVDPLFDFHLLPPTLRHLSMALYRPAFSPYNLDDSVLLTAAMEQLASAIPSLLSLKISDLSWETPQPEISWKMASFKSLRKLDITPHLTADAPILTTISQFQHLHALSVHISADCAHLHGCFQALTELSIGGRAAHIQSFITATSPPLLRSLSLFFLHDPSTEAVLQCLSIVPSAVPTALTALALECKLALHPKIPAVMDVVQPMLAFRALTRFTFSFKPLPSIGDDDIVAMLSAWPALNALRIEHDYVKYSKRRPPPFRPTAHILPIIAARCPHLDTLELPEIELLATPTLDSLPSTLGKHPLRVLDLQSECADRAACVRAAALVDRLFPSMVLPQLRGWTLDPLPDVGWVAVVDLLEEWREGRGTRALE